MHCSNMFVRSFHDDFVLWLTTGLCAGVALEFLPSRNRCPAFDKDKYLEPMFGNVGQAHQQLGYTKLLITATPSRTLHKTHCWLLT